MLLCTSTIPGSPKYTAVPFCFEFEWLCCLSCGLRKCYGQNGYHGLVLKSLRGVFELIYFGGSAEWQTVASDSINSSTRILLPGAKCSFHFRHTAVEASYSLILSSIYANFALPSRSFLSLEAAYSDSIKIKGK